MHQKDNNYILIESNEALNQFALENKNIEWLGFDTEFIGEKRYTPLLCLIQVATINGNYLIDTIALKDIQVFLEMVENPSILKITHAGENDYSILHQHYQTIPQNIFDIQKAAGFIGFGYPVAFSTLLKKTLRKNVSKSQTVTDWKARPLSHKQIRYALNDIIYLKDLFDFISKKLKNRNRFEWVLEECSKWSNPKSFSRDPIKDAIKNKAIQRLGLQEQLLMIRLYLWREAKAKEQNIPREHVLQGKYILPVVETIKAGKSTVRNDRRIPSHIFEKYWSIFSELHNGKQTKAEEAYIERIPSDGELSNKQSLMYEFLHLMLSYKCVQHDIATQLLLPRGDFNLIRTDNAFYPDYLEKGWRSEIVGSYLNEWMKGRILVELEEIENGFLIKQAK